MKTKLFLTVPVWMLLFINNTMGLCTPPGITAITGNTTACQGSSRYFDIIATGDAPLTYQWQLDAGGGFVDLSDGSVYTGVNTPTLTITTVTVTMNNYVFHCVVTSTCTPAATSNDAVLTVPNITAVISSTNVDCGGSGTGTAMVSGVGGGTPPYTYLWSPGSETDASISGLAAGNYSCLVTDWNGCAITTQTVSVSYPAANALQTDVKCYGESTGSATVTVSGGTAPYAYSWLPSGGTNAMAPGLIAGSYTCVVTDAYSCLTTTTLAVTQPPAVTATAGSTNIDCGGSGMGTATVTVGGGTTPYTYLWSPGAYTGSSISVTATGIYSCLVTDANACFITKTVSITKPTATTTQSNVNCNGGSTGSASVVVTKGTTPYAYLWSTGGTNSSITNLSAATYTCTITDALSCTIVKTIVITQNGALTATISHEDVRCYNTATGSGVVSASGPGFPFSYLWKPSGGSLPNAFNLVAGTYSCTTTNGYGCTITKTVTVSQPPALTAVTGQTNVLCNGGSTGNATITAGGGTSPLNYLWLPSGGTDAVALNLPAATYSCVATDGNNCALTKTLTITQPSALAITTTKTNILCNGTATGSANVSVTGGVSPYAYLWMPGGTTTPDASNVAAGSYSCTVTDANSCIKAAAVTITQLPAITAVVTHENSCGGSATGSASITATGGTSPYNYLWTPGGSTQTAISNLSAGSYSCTTEDANNCSVQSTFTVVQAAPPAVTLAVSEDTVCVNSGPVTLTGTPAGGTYTGEGVSGSNFNTGIVISGTYTINYSYTDELGCSASQAAAIYVDECLGIPAPGDPDSPVKIYPNPFIHTTTMEVAPSLLNHAEVNIEIYDGMGRLVKKESVTKVTTAITNENMPSGVYYYRVTGDANLVSKGILILQ